jgi:molecular chaperone GrpE|tara:strand:- start:671 stop:1267 length:597 start_codon:yes stop_codon:yes gene_type:complete
MTNEKTLDKNPDDNLDQTNISDKEIKESEEKSSPEEVILNLEDKLTRSFAEMENQRRRFEKEKEDAFDYGGFTFAREALNLLDNLERSKESLQNDETLKNTDALKKISEHLNIIHNDMINIFKKNGIEPIIALNKKLDPNIHQAMIEIEDDNKDIGTIIKEIQKGFMMKDRLLRPSLVGVSKKANKTENEKNDKKPDK